ncbi:MAG: SpoIID/LytB domain-containing protein, partial [Chloroflexota bacterium]|nr:SpoIID/LytB domain-containing protein [Chloroflexota bacterium]
LFHFGGNGSDHGVGLSQQGARARANAGQTHAQILAHYYTGSALGTVAPGLRVRVRLADSYQPTSDVPARVVARGGSWQSALFPGNTFPADSYLEMTPDMGTWSASVFDATDSLLARVSDATDVLMEPAEPATLFEMRFRDSLRRYDRYRGEMRLRLNGAGIQAINVVSMNDYLRGVVPAEMPATWHIEAVRAQAIASRGYAYAKLRTTGFFDLRPDSNDQVYGGVNVEHWRSNAAVVDTDDVVVTVDGKPVQTYFFALAGGHTENNEYVFGVSAGGNVTSTPLSYLRGQPDLDPDGLPWDRNAPNFAWSSGSFTMAQLSAVLANDPRTAVGELNSVAFERGVSGRVYRATLTGVAGTKVVSGNIFKSVYNAHKLSGGNLRSNMFYLQPTL